MQPTLRPPRPRPWNTRRQLSERLHARKVPPDALQRLEPYQSMQDLQAQSLQELRELQRLQYDWPHVARPDIVFYTPKQIQQLIRFNNAVAHAPPVASMPPQWLRDHRPSVTTSSPYDSPSARTTAHPWKEWGNLASGWAAGAVLLMAALLMVRYIDRCLARKLVNSRRRQSEEWPTPTVLATSHQYPIDRDSESLPRLSDFDGSSDTSRERRNCDLPPPYSECAEPGQQTTNKQGIAAEELPPPYTACYVAFSNPKDGIPSVHFYNEQGQTLTNEPQINENETENTSNETNGCETLRDNFDAMNSTRDADGSDGVIIDSVIASTSNVPKGENEHGHFIEIGTVNSLPEELY